MKILMTGFDPFGGEQINPSREASSMCLAFLPKPRAKTCRAWNWNR